MSDWRYEFLVALHEQVEWAAIWHRGLAVAEIDAFDIMFERERDAGLHTPDEEPGFDPRAPYLAEHTLATKIEREVATMLGVDWDEYSREVNAL